MVKDQVGSFSKIQCIHVYILHTVIVSLNFNAVQLCITRLVILLPCDTTQLGAVLPRQVVRPSVCLTFRLSSIAKVVYLFMVAYNH